MNITITDFIVSRNPKTVSIYRLIMMGGNDNFRVLRRNEVKDIEVVNYGSVLGEEFFHSKVIKGLYEFKKTIRYNYY